ncbi:midnolin-B [Aulostomus maculatus]
MKQQRGMWSSTPGRAAGCGAGLSTTMRLSISSTTGSPLELTVPRGETVLGLRRRISQKLKVQTDKIVLLHKDKQLSTGKLLDLDVADGSRLTLVPAIEAGLVCSTSRAERTMMDMLESLTEVQISDFLSGRAPLTINLGVGAHTMYVQLQLSAQDLAELQQEQDSRIPSRKLPTSVSPTNVAPPPVSDSADSTQLSSQRPTTVPAVTCHHHSCPPGSPHTPPSTHSLPSGCPHPNCPLQAATPVCSRDPSGPSPGPPSPVPASTVTETNSSPTDPCQQPRAVIDSLVSHSPGVFSGTFSGTLAPCSHSRHPRHGISIILHILEDLLKAASRHQGALPADQPCPASRPAVWVEESSKAPARPGLTQMVEQPREAPEERRSIRASAEENQTLHCKLEHLHFLMDQRRLRRRTRSHLWQTSRPYQQSHHFP